MKKTLPNRIAEVRKSKGLTQPQLAEILGVHWITLSKLERGITKLNFQWAERISAVLEVDPYDLMPPRSVIRRMALSGYVHRGGVVEAIAEDESKTFTFNSDIFDDIDTEWIEVKGDALYPYFKDGDIIGIHWVFEHQYQDDKGELDLTGFHGRFCLVEDEDGDQFIGIVAPSSSKSLVDLHNANYAPIHDIKPIAMAQVTVSIMPTPLQAKESIADRQRKKK